MLFAKADGALVMHDWVDVPNPDLARTTVFGNTEKRIIRTTVGRMIFNQVWPEGLGFVNFPVPKGKLGDLILQTTRVASEQTTSRPSTSSRNSASKLPCRPVSRSESTI